jgi:hypothetical protein
VDDPATVAAGSPHGVLFGRIERLVATEVGRGSARLAAASRGWLAGVTGALLASPGMPVVMLTGFYVGRADPPAPETDGPVGAVLLARVLGLLGHPVRLLTDDRSVTALRGAAEAAGMPDVPVDVLPVGAGDGPREALVDAYRAAGTGMMISVERVGPSPDGLPRNMLGQDISADTAPLHEIFAAGPWLRVGIGDGGNELGMANLDRALVAEVVPRGALIHCTTGCDWLGIGGTSNWAAAGLAAALAYRSGAADAPAGPSLPQVLSPAWSDRLLAALHSRRLAVDGVTARYTPTVDGLPPTTYTEVLVAVHAACPPPH